MLNSAVLPIAVTVELLMTTPPLLPSLIIPAECGAKAMSVITLSLEAVTVEFNIEIVPEARIP